MFYYFPDIEVELTKWKEKYFKEAQTLKSLKINITRYIFKA
jgi:hypothetical protein